MIKSNCKYLTLEALAIELYLPKTYLKKLVEERAIPFLNVNGRLRFNPETVQHALDKIAAEAGNDERIH